MWRNENDWTFLADTKRTFRNKKLSLKLNSQRIKSRLEQNRISKQRQSRRNCPECSLESKEGKQEFQKHHLKVQRADWLGSNSTDHGSEISMTVSKTHLNSRNLTNTMQDKWKHTHTWTPTDSTAENQRQREGSRRDDAERSLCQLI